MTDTDIDILGEDLTATQKRSRGKMDLKQHIYRTAHALGAGSTNEHAGDAHWLSLLRLVGKKDLNAHQWEIARNGWTDGAGGKPVAKWAQA